MLNAVGNTSCALSPLTFHPPTGVRDPLQFTDKKVEAQKSL